MATFPPSVAAPPPGSQGPGGSPMGSPAGGGGAPAAKSIKLMMLDQAIQELAKEFPGGQQGIKMMMDGLKLLQGISASQSAPPAGGAAPPVL